MIWFKQLGRLLLLAAAGVLLAHCAFQPVAGPRTLNPALEPTPVPTSVGVTQPTFVVERGTVFRDLVFTGRFLPVAESRVLAPVSGEIGEGLVARGDVVAPGDPLLVIDTTLLEEEMVRLRSELEEVETRLAKAQSTIEKRRQQAELSVERARFQLESAQQAAGDLISEAKQNQLTLFGYDLDLAELDLALLD